MVKWRIKSCPRCNGDMFIDKGLYGWYEQCLQCAYQQELRDIGEFKKQLPQREKAGGRQR